MATIVPKAKGISYSIDSILSSTSSTENRKNTVPLLQGYTSYTGVITLPSMSTVFPVMPLTMPDYTDMRTEEQFSECSDVSRKTPYNRASPDLSSPDSSFQSQDSGPVPRHSVARRKKSRTAFSTGQIDSLEKRYSEQRYLPLNERSDLALDLTDQQLKTWFQNRRMKEKRQRRNANHGNSVTLPPDVAVTSGIYVSNQMGFHPLVKPSLTNHSAFDYQMLPRSLALPPSLSYTEVYSYQMACHP